MGDTMAMLDAAALANTYGRTLTLRQGGVLAAAIRFEDTVEREALKAAGFRWDGLAKHWTITVDTAARRALVEALFLRGYVFATDTRTMGALGHRIGLLGIALADARLVRFGRKDRWEAANVAVVEKAVAERAARQQQ